MGRAVKFRPADYPYPTPWWYSVFKDPYERVNVWSHGVPGILFLLLGFAAKANLVTGGIAMTLFCSCTATTHLLSAITHIFPNDPFLEKLDHLGIVALVAGTPITAVMVRTPEASLAPMYTCIAVLVVGAFLPPLLRTLVFVAVGAAESLLYLPIVDANLAVQLVLYVAGGYVFIRDGGHEGRWSWLTDHHLLHYFVTTACCLHLHYIASSLSLTTS